MLIRNSFLLAVFFLSCLTVFGQGLPINRDTVRKQAKAIKTVQPPAQKEVIYQGTPAHNKFEITQEDGKVVVTPETLPYFPGGQSALEEFISKNLRYPEEAVKAGAEGIVLVQFTIEYEGSVHSPIILMDKVGYGASAETKRLVQLMPKWVPATISGESVTVEYTLPVSFNIKKYQTRPGNH